MRLLIFLGALILALSSKQQALADHSHITDTYFVKFHFTDLAFGKPVKSVLVHTGILADDTGFRESQKSLLWVDTHDIPMQHVKDHFFAKAVLQWDFYSPSSSDYGPIVEYWVEFEDQTTMIVSKSLIPILRSDSFSTDFIHAEQSCEAAKTRLSLITDASSTSAEKLSFGSFSFR